MTIETLNSHLHHPPRHEDKCDIDLHLLWGCLFDASKKKKKSELSLLASRKNCYQIEKTILEGSKDEKCVFYATLILTEYLHYQASLHGRTLDHFTENK